jgi:hypothetical protein
MSNIADILFGDYFPRAAEVIDLCVSTAALYDYGRHNPKVRSAKPSHLEVRPMTQG